MPHRRFAFSALVLSFVACSTSGPRPSSDPGVSDAGVSDAGLSDAGLSDAAQAVDAAEAVDAGLPDVALPLDVCEVRISSEHRVECRDACDARLLLVSGAYYCTFQCTEAAECAPYGLDCIEEMGGVCAPRCEIDADCPSGFHRCDPVGRFCDTYPVEE